MCTNNGDVRADRQVVFQEMGELRKCIFMDLQGYEEAEAGLPGGSRDLLSLWGGHTRSDTSAHLH